MATKTYDASGTVNPRRIIKVSGDRTVEHAAADSDIPLGISARDESAYDQADHATSGEQADVYLLDGTEIEVELGGTVAAGGFVVADSDGRAVAATIEDVSSSQNATSVYAIGPVISGGAVGEIGIVAGNLISGRKQS